METIVFKKAKKIPGLESVRKEIINLEDLSVNDFFDGETHTEKIINRYTYKNIEYMETLSDTNTNLVRRGNAIPRIAKKIYELRNSNQDVTGIRLINVVYIRENENNYNELEDKI